MKAKYLIILLILTTLIVGVTSVLRSNRPSPQTQAEALEEAREFKAGNCVQVVTPAKHMVTGAQYTFPTGCIPPGWKHISQTTQ